MDTISSCPTVLLSDNPASKDLFDGAHDKLADAILELVHSNQGGKTIGLEGKWGSGKSTVINLLKEKLERNKSTSVFIFDAWAHRGDPLRRSFLERAVLHLKETTDWINKDNWDKEINTLRKKKQDTETFTSPKITLLGVLVIICVLLVPLGLSLVDANLKSSITDDLQFVTPLNQLFVVGIVITISPILVYLLGGILITFANFLAIRILKLKTNIDFPWAILAQNYDTVTKTTVFSTPDPTSVEFEEKFDSLIKEALSDEHKRLVIVLDNLDRVDAQDAISILTTLQTFLNHKLIDTSPNEQKSYSRLWAIIPYDIKGMTRLWENHNENQAIEVANSMINKMFQIRFHVPPLLLSGWREFLISQLKIAFPKHDTEEHIKDFHNTFMIYRDMMLSENIRNNEQNKINLPPSPRDIKHFINQIGAIHRQWGDKFPLYHIAYYVAASRMTEDFPEKLRNKKLPPSRLLSFGEDELGNLAAMYFNVEKKLALQFLLQEYIEAALVEKDYNQIKKYEDLHNKGFWATLESINFDQYNLQMLTNAGWALSESGVFLKEGNSIIKNTILTSLGTRTQNLILSQINGFDKELAQGLISISKLTENPSIVTKALENATSTNNELPLEDVSSWVEGVITTIKHDWVREKIQTPTEITIPGNAEAFALACYNLFSIDKDRKYWTIFTSSTPQRKEVIEHFNKLISGGKLNKKQSIALRVALNIVQEQGWKTAAEQIYNRLNTNENYDHEEILSLLFSLWCLLDNKHANNKQFTKLATNGNIYHYLHVARSKTDPNWDAISWCVYTLLKWANVSSSPAASGNAQDGYNYLTTKVFKKPDAELINSLTEISIEREDIKYLIDLPSNANTLKQKIIDLIVEKNLPIITPEIIATSWKNIKEFSGNGFSELLSKLNIDQALTQYLVSQQFIYSDTELYLTLLPNNATNEHFLEWVKNGMRNITKDIWAPELEREGILIELVMQMAEKQKDDKSELDLDVNYLDALLEHVSKTIKNEITPSRLVQSWHLLPSALNRSLRENFRRRLIRLAQDANGSIGASFFDCYINEISEENILITDKDTVLLLFLPLLSNRNQRGIQWLADFLEMHHNFLKNYSPISAVDEFKKRFESINQEDNIEENTKQQIERLNRFVIGIPSIEQSQNT